MENGSKNLKKMFFRHFDFIVNIRFCVLCNSMKDTHLRQFFGAVFICLTSFFQGYFPQINWIIVVNQFASLTMSAMETEKIYFSSYQSNGC